MKLNFTIVKHLNDIFKLKPSDTILDARNNLFNEIKNICSDMLSSPDQICFIFQNRILSGDESPNKLNIKEDVFVLFAIFGDEQMRLTMKQEPHDNEWKSCFGDDGKVDWMQRDQYLKTLENDQKIQVSLKIMGEKQMNVKNCNYPVLVGLQEPIRIASEILERRFIISAEYHKLICYGMSLDPNKTFHEYQLQNGVEICVYKESPRGNLEFFEIWLTSKDKTSKPLDISQSLPLSDVINEQCLNIKTSFFWTKKQLELDIDESHAGGVSAIDIYFDESQKFFTDMGFAGHGDLYRDCMNNIDWTKREKQLEKLPMEKKIKVFLSSETENSYPLSVDPQENMDIALKYHQVKFKISSQCSLVKDGTALDSQKTFEDGGIKNNDIISVTTELIAFKADFSSSIMIIPDQENCKPFSVPAYFSLNEVMDRFCHLYEASPGSVSLYDDDNKETPIRNDEEFLHVKYLHSAMTTWRHSVEREMKIYLFKSSGNNNLVEISSLGRGAYGRVSMYEDSSSKRKYAMKTMTKTMDDYSRSFKRETDAFNMLGYHPQIVRYFSFTKHCDEHMDEHMMIYMEHMPEGSLRQYLDKNGRKPMKEQEIRNYAKQILKALQYLHHLKIIHRDVRGDNILLDGKGRAKLTDFGLSRKIDDMSETGCIKGMYGNYHWMAPEMMLGEEYDTKVDIWSFGATVIEMMTGRIPYHDFTDNTIRNEIRKFRQIKINYSLESSPNIQSFTSSCLNPTFSRRPTAIELLNHPFLDYSFNYFLNPF